MSDGIVRRVPSRPLTYIACSLMFGLLLSAGSVWFWQARILTRTQKQYLSLYAKVSLPSFSFAPGKSSSARSGEIEKRNVYVILRSRVYKRKPIDEFLMPIVLTVLGIMFAALMVGMSRASSTLRKMRNWIYLRGPHRKTVKEFNKATKGDGLRIKTYKIREEMEY